VLPALPSRPIRPDTVPNATQYCTHREMTLVQYDFEASLHEAPANKSDKPGSDCISHVTVHTGANFRGRVA